ncbi:hypothetical protein DUZ99_01610 [Xylanibacillus composti]|uniref:Tryptophan-rich sensory protein n=1 Tax=Xylanibacillus composti TaxID=1572762 RepID=A0A8J4H5W7_9BACL|nr:hypothetical protein [Xylanibacillus composti]MDT9723695.1 hypothetical protein [Xylanibacillus composti]GIQ71414.1 tryptophan-rich sensory protein [Xylanibacillus composti]
MHDRFYRWLNAGTYALLLCTLGYAGALPLGGTNLAEVYTLYPVILTPAPYSFVILSLIYIGLTGFTLLSFVPAWQRKAEIRKVGPWFAWSCVFHALWLLLLYSGQFTAAVFMLGALLLTTAVVYMRTRSSLYLYSRAGGGQPGRNSWSRDSLVRLWVQLPFSLYAAWNSFIFIWSASMTVRASGWHGGGLPPSLWAICGLLLLFALAVLAGKTNRDIPFMLTIVWMLTAIAINQPDEPTVRLVAWLLAIVLSANAVLHVRSKALART